MSTNQLAGEGERLVSRYEYDDSWVLAADVGRASEDVTVDIVGTTAIVVAEIGDEVSETEFELPGSEASFATNNGVLTITVEK
jgi:HSP20 family molecular chaperone IbpA